MQAAQLHDDEEQEEDDGAAGVREVLPLLSEAYGSSRVQVMLNAEVMLNAKCRMHSAFFILHFTIAS
jgi:hypothetical protein